ncbi:Type VI secretion lipoprotein [Aliarcobacter thereius]|uniref:type VI secretion system lipoprotein TssJ n=1 Tax=Aliarcobacter thereius TaxID=544718 RepID=UPI0008293218|nr:type VI secretion system lipoprotein TssJ [Aliarcobacter thereius]OCL85548.1 Type VI secretion lipoprotein [Aliarcobacter thereius]
MKNIGKIILIIFILLFVSSCAKKPTHLELEIYTSKDLNKDEDGKSSPLMLTFYELEEAGKFSKFDYWTLVEKSNDSLKDDLVSQSKHIILTNQKQTYKVYFGERTKYLGIIGNFKKIDNDYNWKNIIELKKDSYNYEKLEIRNFNIEREQK